MKSPAQLAVLAFASVALAAPALAGELRGSMGSMRSQHRVAVQQDYDFLRTQAQMRALVEKGELVPVEGNADYIVDAQVPHRFARPEIRVFLERLGAQYHAATGHPLVVTSLVRPSTEQPRNAHRLSVHPVGMAVDLRVPATAADRAWLERTLLALEDRDLLDATRERRPPHYHVAVFPAEYAAYVGMRSSAAPVTLAAVVTAPMPAPDVVEAALPVAAADAGAGAASLALPFPLPFPLPVSYHLAVAGMALVAGVLGVVGRRIVVARRR